MNDSPTPADLRADEPLTAAVGLRATFLDGYGPELCAIGELEKRVTI